MKSQKGVAEVAILYVVIAAMAILFIPNNPVGSVLGVVQKPNKTVQTEKVEMIKDADGNPIALRTITKTAETQQKVSFFEWLGSLPVFVLFLMVMGIIFPPLAAILARLWASLKKETRNIVQSVDRAMDEVKDDELKKKMLLQMEAKQNESTKALVDKMQGKK